MSTTVIRDAGRWRKVRDKVGEPYARSHWYIPGHGMVTTPEEFDACVDKMSPVDEDAMREARNARRYEYLAADGDRARRILNEFSGHEVEAEIDRGIAEEKQEILRHTTPKVRSDEQGIRELSDAERVEMLAEDARKFRRLRAAFPNDVDALLRDIEEGGLGR